MHVATCMGMQYISEQDYVSGRRHAMAVRKQALSEDVVKECCICDPVLQMSQPKRNIAAALGVEILNGAR